MTLPSFLSEKTAKAIGAGGIIALFSLWIVYQVFLTGQVAISQDIADIEKTVTKVEVQNQTLMQQHSELGPQMREGNRIQCAACWNLADNADEIRRCNCSPDRE